ncbi:transposase [Candidatus Pantoea formicae]|uniref:transposase n=1 Tax=Candidatus Pantoea formicae TaxID=2608355 RepID=UPI003ED94FE9
MLNGGLEAVQALVDDHTDNHPDLKRDMEYLTSIKGVGTAVGNTMLAVLRGNHFRSAEPVAAWLGGCRMKSAPEVQYGEGQGCQNVAPRRGAKLYIATMVAAKHNPHLKAFYDRLVLAGKAKRSALGSVMRKLVHICFGVLMKQQRYDENYAVAA